MIFPNKLNDFIKKANRNTLQGAHDMEYQKCGSARRFTGFLR